MDSETLTARPEQTLSAASDHFGLAAPENLIAGHAAFATHSKFGGSFDTADRAAEHQAAADAHGEEIEKVLVWAAAVADAAGISLELPGALPVDQS